MSKLTKDEAEIILVQNRLKPTAPDEVIRSALFRANWHNDDIEMVLVVLRENVNTHETHLDAARNLMQADLHLTPKQIHDLLGIDVDITLDDIGYSKKRARGALSFDQIAEIAIVSMFFSALVLFGGMWHFKVGMFHQTLI